MDGWLRQSTAVTVPIGPFVDSTDGDAEETGLTIAQADVRLSKNGAASAQKNNATSASHDADGVYLCPLSTTDTNTLGQLVAWVHVAGALFAKHVFMVLPANAYDSLVLGTDALDVSLIQWLGTAPLALTSQRVEGLVGAMAANVLTATAINADALTAAKFAADVTTEFQDGLATAASLSTAQTDLTTIKGYLDTEVAAILAAVDTEIAAIKAKTDNLPSDPADQSAVEAAITAAVAALIAENADLFDFGIMNSTTIASLTSQTVFRVTDGSANDNAYNGRIGVVKDSATDLQRCIVHILDYSGATKEITLAADPAIFTMAVGDYITITSVPYSSGGGGATAAEVRAEMDANSVKLAAIDTATGTAIPATLATMDGKLDTIDNLLDTEIGSIITSLGTIAGYLDTEIAAILADTNELQTDWADGGRLDLLIDAIKAITDALPDAGALTSIAQEATITSTGRADPSALAAAPAASLSLAAKVDWLFANVMRAGSFNKTTGEQKIKNSAGTDIAKATAADDGTTTSRGAYGAP